MYPYEALYIIRPDMADEARVALVEKFQTLITGAGGAIDKHDEWGTRKLAYPIQFLNEGYFVLVNFTAPGDFVREFERNLRINENILRFMVVRTDE